MQDFCIFLATYCNTDMSFTEHFLQQAGVANNLLHMLTTHTEPFRFYRSILAFSKIGWKTCHTA